MKRVVFFSRLKWMQIYLFFLTVYFSWLYHETTVQDTSADEDGNIVATVVMDEAARKKYQAKFGKID